MVSLNTPTIDTGGGGGGFVSISGQHSLGQSVFLISGEIGFGPFYSPDRISVSKERNLNRQENFCGGEDVTDTGAKNREIHVSGRILKSELGALENLLDFNAPLDLTTDGWSGEIRVLDGDYEGPVGYDPIHKDQFFTYSLDLLSTGRDEYEIHGDNGILAP